MKFFGTRQFNLWLALIGLLLLVLITLQFTERRGAKTKEELISQYIAAIRQENPNQIVQLMPNSHVISQAELTNIIVNSGGKAVDQVKSATLPSESGNLEIVKLTGTYTKNGKLDAFTDILYLQKTSERWYLLLGRDKNGLPTDAPSSKTE